MRFAPLTLSLLLTSCGTSLDRSESENVQRADDNWQYEFYENGCSTGKITGSGRTEQCKALRNEQQNNYCAKAARQLALKQLCLGDDPQSGPTNRSDAEPTPNPAPSPAPPRQQTCGYQFDRIDDTSSIRSALRGTWVDRSAGIRSEHGRGQSRSYKDGFFFDFTGSELGEVRVYHVLNGADLRPTAISHPPRGTSLSVSVPMPWGSFAGWQLLQWNHNNDHCVTIAVGFERLAGDARDTLMVIGPIQASRTNATSPLTMEDFFDDAVGNPRQFKFWSDTEMPIWEPIGL
jgi:hypothetical protein